ncbi:MFS transporter [Brachybacterium endophyticum]|uniref:Putative proline/betaine transporter n=2 Tax=Brachybacterium endophyticum TaxID=2182385 RepID=A0A2U2RMI3_9MICO|nr:MFS transporter [Brachybacterium endophyticum]PWH07080.1 MFS transporter [Brachybacterium endophyticum]
MSTSSPHGAQAAGPSSAAAPRQSTLKTLLGTGIGNALEWYDWNIYASFAVYFSAQAFDSSDKASAFLSTMAIFAVGFVARPFGGVVFGWIGDRIGRKQGLTLAVLCASGGSLLIALLPTYESVGLFASVVLLLARLVQGLAHGGELPSAQTYLAEHAPRERRGFWASSIYVTGTLGLLAGLLIGLFLSSVLTEAQMSSWGWRVPFALGAVLGLVALWIRSSMVESDVFEENRAAQQESGEKTQVWRALMRNWRTGLIVIGMTMGLTVSYYVWSVSIASLAQQNLHYSSEHAFEASLIGNIVLIIALPLWGAASDRIGRKACAVIALMGSAVAYIPMVLLIQGEFWQLVVSISVQLALLAGFISHAPAMYAEMFSTAERTSGFGIPYAVAIALFGGTAPYVNTFISSHAGSGTGGQVLFGVYAIALMVISTLTIVLTLPETKGKDLRETGAASEPGAAGVPAAGRSA